MRPPLWRTSSHRTVSYTHLHQKIKNTFGNNNMVAIIVPKGNYDAERQILQQLEACPEVDSAQGLANTEAHDG